MDTNLPTWAMLGTHSSVTFRDGYLKYKDDYSQYIKHLNVSTYIKHSLKYNA